MPGDRCPVCDSTRTRRFLSRESVAVHQNLLTPTRAAALAAPRGDLAFAACGTCGFVFNAAFDAAKLAYGTGYENDQSHSPFFAEYVAALAERLVRAEGVTNCRIVEVGCGRGDFLRSLVEDASSGNTGVGFDPSYSGPDEDCDGRLRFVRSYYDAGAAGVAAGVAADVVICRHVIEHVARPVELLRSVRAALHSPAPRVFFETPCAEWILDNAVIWDFFYEHCSLFTPSSLRTAFERAGFAVRSIGHAFGGQYLWAEAALTRANPNPELHPGEIVAKATRFAREEERLRVEWSRRVRDLTQTGKVAIWGAGAKGVTFAQLVDPDCTLVDCLVDLNPNKQGKFTPGTGHPIVGAQDLGARGVTHAILMNPNYRAENEALLAQAKADVRLVE